jgi:hypothetical protein
MIICSNQLSARTCVLSHWSWRTPCAERIACQTTTVPSQPLRDFPNREQLCTTVNEHSSSLPLSTSPELTQRHNSVSHSVSKKLKSSLCTVCKRISFGNVTTKRPGRRLPTFGDPTQQVSTKPWRLEPLFRSCQSHCCGSCDKSQDICLTGGNRVTTSMKGTRR